jgi:hypothetical protein
MPTVIDLLSLGRSTQHSILLHVEVTEHVIQEGKSGRCIPQPEIYVYKSLKSYQVYM